MRRSLKRHVLVLLREKLDLTQKDFADAVDCSESTLEAVERGPKRLKLSRSLAEKIFARTGVSPDWLLANDFERPMVDGVNNSPYTKAVFEEAQSKARLPTGMNLISNHVYLSSAFERLLGAYCSAEKTSASAAKIVTYRIQNFAKQLTKEFGSDDLRWGKAQTALHKLDSTLGEVLSAANPQGTEKLKALHKEVVSRALSSQQVKNRKHK